MTTDIKTILVPIDFSANSARALDYAKMLAQRFGAAIHLVHVCEVPSMATASMDAYAIAYSDWSQRLGDEAEHELARVAAGVHGIKTSTEILFGHPARCIITAATTNQADLIVMGTHGHGPVLHVVMGSVAERVVRTAPCPVMTVREPRAIEWHKSRAKAGAAAVAAAVLLAFLLAPPAAARADAQTAPEQASTELLQRITGGEVFRTYCVTCHGPQAKGDGPLAQHMTRKPANLTEIAKRNDGVFPEEIVFRTIDGRKKVKGHGGPDMPEWADAFARSRQSGDTTAIKDTIDSLVRYIESLQVR
jgi:nucleotide-binding universal stress UspA family protein/mono/diheme cytochrome c family protein